MFDLQQYLLNTLGTYINPAEIRVHLPIDLGGLNFLSSLFFNIFLKVFKIRLLLLVVNQTLKQK